MTTMTTTITANRLFLVYTVCLVLIWIMVLATATSNLLPPQETLEEETKNTRNCKGLCDHCQCLGFYCGEECICECNNEQSDTECIAGMQSKARTQRMPFEILIQGPTANSFVRNALQFEQNFKKKNNNKNSCHTKRSTVMIYKPSKDLKSLNNLEAMKVNEEKKSPTQRIKRSENTQFEWFQDLSNTLVRPAPLGPRPKKIQETEITTQTAAMQTSTQKMPDISWFSDYTPNVLTPRPLQRKKTNENSEEATSTSTKSLQRNAMQAFRQDIASALEEVSNSRDPDNDNHHGDNGDSEKKSFLANIFKGINDDLDTKLQLGTKASEEEQSLRKNNRSFISKVLHKGKSNTFQGINDDDDDDDVENDFVQNSSDEEDESQEEQPQRREPQRQQHTAGRRKIYKNNAFSALSIPWLRRANDVADKSQEEQPQRKALQKQDTAGRSKIYNINALSGFRMPWLRPNIFLFKNFKLP